MIRFIIHNRTSSRDINGNCYHYAIITSIQTKKSIHVVTWGPSNCQANVMNLLGLEYEHIYTMEETITKRQYNAATKNIKLYEHDLTKEMLLELEK